MQDILRLKYGFWVVIIGMLVVCLIFVVSILRWSLAADVASAVGAAAGVIGTIVGAFFGVQVGSAGKEMLEAQRDIAVKKIEELQGVMSPAEYQIVKNARPDLFGP